MFIQSISMSRCLGKPLLFRARPEENWCQISHPDFEQNLSKVRFVQGKEFPHIDVRFPHVRKTPLFLQMMETRRRGSAAAPGQESGCVAVGHQQLSSTSTGLRGDVALSGTPAPRAAAFPDVTPAPLVTEAAVFTDTETSYVAKTPV